MKIGDRVRPRYDKLSKREGIVVEKVKDEVYGEFVYVRWNTGEEKSYLEGELKILE